MKEYHIGNYYKAEICGTPYLLSYGQSSAEGGFVLRLNESGSLLWDGICRGLDKAGLLSLLAGSYQAEEEEFPILRQDIGQFLALLNAHGILIPPSDTAASHAIPGSAASAAGLHAASVSVSGTTDFHPDAAVPGTADLHAASDTCTFRIGTLKVSCSGAERLCEQYFKRFSCAPAAPDLHINILRHAPLPKRNGKILLRTRELVLYDCEAFYLFSFSDDWHIHEMRVRKDGSAADIYCSPSCPEGHMDALFHAIRFAFLIIAQKRGLFALHSASLLYHGRAWLFSGCSGTGKSTHTALWQQEFGTPLLNGDLNLLGISDGIPTAYGLPWCGTSEICTPENYPLGGIVFLKQAPYNRATRLSHEDASLALFQRLISPSWTEALTTENLGFSITLCRQIPCFRLECTKDAEAAEVMRAAIDAL